MTDAVAPRPTDGERAAALFHRQLVLLATAVIVAAVGIVAVMWVAATATPTPAVVRPVYYAGSEPVLAVHQPPALSPWALPAAVAATVAAAAVLAAAVVHAGRVAAFTFRRTGDR